MVRSAGQEPNPQPVLEHRAFRPVVTLPVTAGEEQRETKTELLFCDVLKPFVNQVLYMLFRKDAQIKGIYPKKGQLIISTCVLFKGHHETPLSAPTKILEKFPSNLPKRPENVIPADSDKAAIEEVCDEKYHFTG